VFNLSKSRILAIGKIRKEWIKSGLTVYKKRLPKLSITEIRDSDPNKEAEAIRSLIKPNEFTIVLCEEGEKLSSIDLTNKMQELSLESLVFVIGGANGLSPVIKNTAHFRLSLSPLTFPHEIARLLLLEQLYRASTIANGGPPYHRS